MIYIYIWNSFFFCFSDSLINLFSNRTFSHSANTMKIDKVQPIEWRVSSAIFHQCADIKKGTKMPPKSHHCYIIVFIIRINERLHHEHNLKNGVDQTMHDRRCAYIWTQKGFQANLEHLYNGGWPSSWINVWLSRSQLRWIFKAMCPGQRPLHIS